MFHFFLLLLFVANRISFPLLGLLLEAFSLGLVSFFEAFIAQYCAIVGVMWRTVFEFTPAIAATEASKAIKYRLAIIRLSFVCGFNGFR